MEIVDMLLPKGSCVRPGLVRERTIIVPIHFTWVPGQPAKDVYNYYKNECIKNNVSASANYVIDKDSILCLIPHHEISWGIGAIQYWHYTPFVKVLMERYGVKSPHSLAINIECCYDEPSGEFPVEVVNNLNYLWKQLITFYPYLQTNKEWALCRHWDITGKECPKYYIGKNREWEDLKIAICKRD